MPRIFTCGRSLRPFVLPFVVWAGCTLLSGCMNILGLTPSGHRLTSEAKALRSAHSEPLPLPRELSKRTADPYTVEPGDVLLVQPVNLESPVRLPGDQTVLPDGTIQLGKFGQIVVAGKTIPQIESEVRAHIETQEKNAGSVTARLVTRVSKVYYVLGEVNAPGAFPLQGRETVLDAILAAGGLNDRASKKYITLTRPTKPNGCRVVLPICYNEITQIGDTSTNYQIAAGDRIYVPTRGREDCKRRNLCPPCLRPQVPCTDSNGIPVGCPSGGEAPTGDISSPTPLSASTLSRMSATTTSRDPNLPPPIPPVRFRPRQP